MEEYGFLKKQLKYNRACQTPAKYKNQITAKIHKLLTKKRISTKNNLQINYQINKQILSWKLCLIEF